jgi:hypothetical protein
MSKTKPAMKMTVLPGVEIGAMRATIMTSEAREQTGGELYR